MPKAPAHGTNGISVQVFAANDASYRNRKRAHRACDQCKKRRKKCEPPFKNHDRCRGCTRDDLFCNLGSSRVILPTNSTSHGGEGPPPFIGDMNPQSAFVSDKPNSNRDQGNCGVWSRTILPPDEAVAATRAQKKTEDTPSKALDQEHERHMKNIGGYEILPTQNRNKLIDLYLSSVHPVLPLIDKVNFVTQHNMHIAPITLLHAVLLVASRHPDAEQHLEGTPPRVFAKDTARKIRCLLHSRHEEDPINLARIYGLLALHSEGPEGNDEAYFSLYTAIFNAQRVGLHLESRSRTKSQTQLWWALWSLDGLLAAVTGKPTRIADNDIGILQFSPESTGTAFLAWLQLAHLLLKVIDLYRPRSGLCAIEWETAYPEPFPLFSAFHPKESVPYSSICMLRLFYNAIAILSTRTSIQGHSIDRRLSSAGDILETLKIVDPVSHGIKENGTAKAPPSITPETPLVPYAACLAMTTFFRALKDGENDINQKDFGESIAELEKQKGRWWNSGAMATLGRQADRQLREKKERDITERERAGAVLASMSQPRSQASSQADLGSQGDQGTDSQHSGMEQNSIPWPFDGPILQQELPELAPHPLLMNRFNDLPNFEPGSYLEMFGNPRVPMGFNWIGDVGDLGEFYMNGNYGCCASEE